MSKLRRNRIARLASRVLCTLLSALSVSSCESFFEDLEPCPHGVSLRFVYDYNMAYANAFSAKVDCLTVLIYDDKGHYVGTRTVTGPELQDEAYRMRLDLEEGTYRFIAYGGMACEKRSFVFSPALGEEVAMERQEVRLDADIAAPVHARLHDLYWGDLVLETSDLYNGGTVKMMKNTNNIRIVLQQMNGEPVYAKNFRFRITDDNTRFAWNNDLLSNGTVIYQPWAKGEASTGVADDDKEVVVAYAEFSTSRLVTGNSPRLVIGKAADGKEIVNIPLNNYLLLLKSELYEKMEAQEFLDRESEWSLVFFLDRDNVWIKTFIKINDWTVRLNDAEL